MSKNILMIHGMMVGPWSWDNYRHYFEGKGYSCYSPPLRFHDMDPNDKPDPRLGATSLLEYAADLEQEISRFEEPPILMAHSMGGLLAQILAGRGCGRVGVLLNPAPPSGIHALNYRVLRNFSEVLGNWGFWRKPFRFSFDKAVYAAFHLLPAEEQRSTCEKLVYESGRAATQIGFWFLDSSKASRVDATRVYCPLLVISGTEDRMTPASVVRKVARKYKNASYKQFDNHAHWTLGEPGWQDIAAYIFHWLQSNAV